MGFDISRRNFLAAAAAASCAPRLLSAAPAGAPVGVMDLTRSPYAKLHTVPIAAVSMQDGFWASRMRVNQDVAVPFTWREMEDHGRFDNFVRWDGPRQKLRAGFVTSHPSGLRAGGDSETYKWIDAASFALESRPSPALRKTLDTVTRQVVGAQEPSGYLNTYFVEARIPERMLTVTQFDGHEFYNAGHLVNAGLSYFRATGDRTLLDAGKRYIDGFILPDFGPEPDRKPLLSGHPGAEMALIELYRATGDARYLKLVSYVLRGDPRIPLERGGSVFAKRDLAFNSTFLFCGIPFAERTKLGGHAVRCLYACCGATDYYLETGDPAYKAALETLWHDLVDRKMYITGGVGVSRAEVFGEPYELPNLTAYGESCASIANMMWNWRLLCATGEARFADVMERVLYNGVNAGVSLDGKLYNYRNPLAVDPAEPATIRRPWYNVNCCPPNLERTFASLPGYLYSTSKDGVYVHLYENCAMQWRLEDGKPLRLAQKTNYPWSGDVQLTVSPAQPSEFTLYVRIPGWSKNTKVTVDGVAVGDAPAGSYLPIRRRWGSGSIVSLEFDMTPRITAANPKVESNAGKVAVERGPLVYCMEQIDQPGNAPLGGFSLALHPNRVGQIEAVPEPGLLGGVVTLRAPGIYATPGGFGGQALYQPLDAATPQTVSLKLIPYYTFANRAPSAMQVWIPFVRTA
jgi:hypothetical protein